MLKTILILAGVCVVADPLASTVLRGGVQDVTLSGTAKTCLNTSPAPVSAVNVGFYRVSNARPLIAHLDSMDKFPGFGPDGADPTAHAQFDAMESVMQRMAYTTTAIFSRTSAPDGTFSITISPIDSVLVLGYENMEDEPYVYDYKIMPGTVSTSFVLDMSRGQCGF
jgi:hypothetical protein